MLRGFFALVICAAFGFSGLVWAQHGGSGKGESRVKIISQKDIAEKLDGKSCKASIVEVTLEAGQASAPHRHPGPVFGYVIEGAYEWAIDNNPARILKAGDTFYEPTGCLHRVSRNPAAQGKTRLLATVLHPREASKIVIPENSPPEKATDQLSPGQGHADRKLPRSSPEAQGVSSEAIRGFVVAADKEISTMHSFMLVRYGHVVAEGWWKPQTPETAHALYSLSKSFTSTAVGLAIAEGKLRLDDEVVKFFPDLAPAEPSRNLKAMRVRDLLTMSTGHQTPPKFTSDVPWVRTALAHPVPHKPGTHFLYDSSASYLLSAIVQTVTGQTVLDYLRPRLFEPLGIANPTWGTSPQGISLGGYGLSLRTEDIAKFGQLYLQEGKWEGKQLIPASWVRAATGRQMSNGSNPKSDWEQGYGFQFWRCRHGAYRGDGAKGQFCIVLPELDAVVAMTADAPDMQAQLNLVWDRLLSAFHPQALPENPQEQEKLKEALVGLKVRAKTQRSPAR